jgi:hypothetical protein
VIITEAVLRLVNLVGRTRGSLMILDDFHDADMGSLGPCEGIASSRFALG